MNSKAIIATAALGLVCGTVSLADPAERSRMHRLAPPAFTDVDADGDRMVTETEFVAFVDELRSGHAPPPELEERRAEIFVEADGDGDGQLSPEEFESLPHKVTHRRMQMHDPKEFFARGDTDRDGVLNEQEFASLMDALPRPRRHPGDFEEQ